MITMIIAFFEGMMIIAFLLLEFSSNFLTQVPVKSQPLESFVSTLLTNITIQIIMQYIVFSLCCNCTNVT